MLSGGTQRRRRLYRFMLVRFVIYIFNTCMLWSKISAGTLITSAVTNSTSSRICFVTSTFLNTILKKKTENWYEVIKKIHQHSNNVISYHKNHIIKINKTPILIFYKEYIIYLPKKKILRYNGNKVKSPLYQYRCFLIKKN